MLKEVTENKREKVLACVQGEMSIPDKGRAVDTTDKRQAVRGFLNGLGFEARFYESLSYAELTTAYHGFAPQNGLNMSRAGLVSMIIKAGEKNPSDIFKAVSAAIDRYEKITNFECAGIQHDMGLIERLLKDTPVSDQPVTETTVAMPVTAQDTDKTVRAVMALLESLKPAAPVAEFNEARVIALIEKHRVSTEIRVVTESRTFTMPEMHHMALENVIKMIQAGINVLMVGPAGSGKTTIAEQAAKIMGMDFYFNGALSSEYKLSGFVDANGKIVSTAFKRAYENGGLYLFDEIDASMPDALLAFNAALSNNHADFPEGMINKHPKFVCMAAANTFGRGADRIYVGRNQLDGASLDRFCVINIEYDEKLERALTANDHWVDFVQKIRLAVFDLKIRHVVSPRASINGARLMAQGLDRKFVEESAIWKGLDKDSVIKVRAKAGV